MTVNVLLVWLENFPGDFKKDAGCKALKQLQTFAKNELKGKHGDEILRKTQQLVDKTSPLHGKFVRFGQFVFCTMLEQLFWMATQWLLQVSFTFMTGD